MLQRMLMELGWLIESGARALGWPSLGPVEEMLVEVGYVPTCVMWGCP